MIERTASIKCANVIKILVEVPRNIIADGWAAFSHWISELLLMKNARMFFVKFRREEKFGIYFI